MDNRITELEIKVAYQEDTIQQLDHVICDQQEQLDYLKRKISELIDNSKSEDDGNESLLSAIDEVPPHY
ncbi:MAG: SlyX family protein [Cycloclasticus sp.]|nr:SlyX family protein [Cycloclasticus sp.]